MRHGALGAGALATSSLWLSELARAQGGTITNVVANPRVAQALTGWQPYAESGSTLPLVRRTDDGVSPGTTCAELTFTSTSSQHRGAILIMRDAPSMACTPNEILWVQAAGKIVAADAGAELWLSLA